MWRWTTRRWSGSGSWRSTSTLRSPSPPGHRSLPREMSIAYMRREKESASPDGADGARIDRPEAQGPTRRHGPTRSCGAAAADGRPQPGSAAERRPQPSGEQPRSFFAARLRGGRRNRPLRDRLRGVAPRGRDLQRDQRLRDARSGVASGRRRGGPLAAIRAEGRIPLAKRRVHGRDFAASALATGRREAEWYLWLRRALARAAARTMWAIDSAGDPDPALAHLRRDLDAAGNAGSALARLSKAPGPPLP